MLNKNLEYQIFRENLTNGEIAKTLYEINNSKNFKIDKLNHIVIKETNTRVGYIGDDTLEIINPNKKKFSEYHNKLKEIFNYTLHNQH